jgi:AraC-like DNA-binding protein/quercetin dioxygenase-like cupin family protein
MKARKPDTPVYCLVDFGTKANETSFYIEEMKTHLETHKFIILPHKHDFYVVLYVTQGGGTHTIDFHDYPVTPGIIFFMTPGQVHSWKLEAGTNGYILFFAANFYQMQANQTSLVDLPFFHSLSAAPFLHLPNQKTIDLLIQDMSNEFHRDSKADLRLLRSYLDLLLLVLSKEYKSTGDVLSHSVNFKLRRLEQLIEKNFIKLKKPSEYADLINLSPSYLNNLCKQNLGKTLSELIQSRILLEAKRLFVCTDLTASQVAHKLNFSDASYFNKFFKRNAGLTPEQFKESINSTT